MEEIMKSVFDEIKQVSEQKEQQTAQIHVIGFGRRFAAMVVDGFIVVFVSFILALLIGMVDVFFGSGTLNWNLVIILVMLLFSVFYFTGKWVQTTGQTPGKLLFRIKLVNADSTPLTYGKMFLRYMGYILSGIAASLGFVWIGIDPKNRGWHDLIAKTYVIQLDDDLPEGGDVEIVSQGSKGWVWLLLWVLLAIGAPAVLFSGLWFLGPVVTNILKSFGN
jgi:uncharacterized RDD family membrane protein YckC